MVTVPMNLAPWVTPNDPKPPHFQHFVIPFNLNADFTCYEDIKAFDIFVTGEVTDFKFWCIGEPQQIPACR